MESVPINTPILVVDDDPGLLLSVKATMLSAGLPEPALIADSSQVMELVRKHRFKLILLDLNMPHIGGMELLEQIHQEFPDIECIIVTAVDDTPTAVQAMRFGAYDYMIKPLNAEKLIIVINRALERHSLKQELALHGQKQTFSDLRHPEAFRDIIAEDNAMALIFRQVEVVAPTDYSILISGESGTGKEMIARSIHRQSNRSDAPFVPVNMASFSNSIFEDAFFGHEKGAYTHAVGERHGFFEAAQGGTLFLDEITELDPNLQGKLLRVIEERELYRLGSTRLRNVDVRIVAATNRDIKKEIDKQFFRADLYYRLNNYLIKIPPLRERRKDILPLAKFFTRKHARANGKKIRSISPDLISKLTAYPFPGNVRELENIIASAVLLESSSTLRLESAKDLAGPHESKAEENSQWPSLAQMEKEYIEKVLKFTEGNRSEAAAILGVNVTTVYRKIEKYRIQC